MIQRQVNVKKLKHPGKRAANKIAFTKELKSYWVRETRMFVTIQTRIFTLPVAIKNLNFKPLGGGGDF